MRTDKMVNTISISDTDPAKVHLALLQNRDSSSVIEISNTLYNLLYTLKKTATPIRPQLNGGSRNVIAELLGVSKSLISQYLSIYSIVSDTVKQEIMRKQIGVMRAYSISKLRGKNQEETEKVQLKEISKIIRYHRKITNSKIIRISKGKNDIND